MNNMCCQCRFCASALSGKHRFEYPVYMCLAGCIIVNPQRTACDQFEPRSNDNLPYDRTRCLECRNELICGLNNCGLSNFLDWCARYNVRVTVNTKYCKAFEPKKEENGK